MNDFSNMATTYHGQIHNPNLSKVSTADLVDILPQLWPKIPRHIRVHKLLLQYNLLPENSLEPDPRSRKTKSSG